jgi:hypothetical protein
MEQRFWEKVDKSGDCWLWTARVDREGYGQFTADRHPDGAHRVAWTLAYGPIPDGMDVLHRCDNRPCVRSTHLFLGDQVANNADMVSKGRNRGVAGELHPRSKLTTAQVQEIRAAYAGRYRPQIDRRIELASRFGISTQQIIAIQLGNAWRHLGGAA